MMEFLSPDDRHAWHLFNFQSHVEVGSFSSELTGLGEFCRKSCCPCSEVRGEGKLRRQRKGFSTFLHEAVSLPGQLHFSPGTLCLFPVTAPSPGCWFPHSELLRERVCEQQPATPEAICRGQAQLASPPSPCHFSAPLPAPPPHTPPLLE